MMGCGLGYWLRVWGKYLVFGVIRGLMRTLRMLTASSFASRWRKRDGVREGKRRITPLIC